MERETEALARKNAFLLVRTYEDIHSVTSETFQQFNLEPRIMSGVQALGYQTPTPIQLQAIPPAMQGRNVMGLAQTGTGKTAAFVLPILQRLLTTGGRGYVRALILAPTRELAEQIDDVIQSLGKNTGLRSITIYGGVSANVQLAGLRKGAEIVVACPGRLLDHLGGNAIDLSRLEVLVLDEADNMFDMGFLPDVRRVLRHLPAERQTMLFSATMPTDIRKLAHEILRDPVTVQVGYTEPIGTVSHALYPVPTHLKTALLMELLNHTDTESVLVFTRTKHRAKRVGEQLAKEGYLVASLQGNLSQNRRQAALDGFREGKFQILVATDIAARGIDVTTVSHVINYDIPNTTDAYTHRIGRTGRAAKTGDAFTLVSEEDNEMVRSIEKVMGAKIERRIVKGFDYGKAAPERSTEFARPPREPRTRRSQPVPAAGATSQRQSPQRNGNGAPRSSQPGKGGTQDQPMQPKRQSSSQPSQPQPGRAQSAPPQRTQYSDMERPPRLQTPQPGQQKQNRSASTQQAAPANLSGRRRRSPSRGRDRVTA